MNTGRFTPRVALKLIQKWLSVQLSKAHQPADHVFGFVSERSHVDAAKLHVNANWVLSVDIRNFFQTTPLRLVFNSLRGMGFNAQGASLIANLACLNSSLAQGAPTSPVLSNICFAEMDAALVQIASEFKSRLSRYADDIVYSGTGDVPAQLQQRLTGLFANTPWQLEEGKTSLAVAPKRLKVHGLLVAGNTVRLTKGYRNRLRAYEHLLARGKYPVRICLLFEGISLTLNLLNAKLSSDFVLRPVTRNINAFGSYGKGLSIRF